MLFFEIVAYLAIYGIIYVALPLAALYTIIRVIRIAVRP